MSGSTTTSFVVVEQTTTTQKTVEEEESKIFIEDAEKKILLISGAPKNSTAFEIAKSLLEEAKSLNSAGNFAGAKQKAIDSITLSQQSQEESGQKGFDFTFVGIILGGIVILGGAAFALMKMKKASAEPIKNHPKQEIPAPSQKPKENKK